MNEQVGCPYISDPELTFIQSFTFQFQTSTITGLGSCVFIRPEYYFPDVTRLKLQTPQEGLPDNIIL